MRNLTRAAKWYWSMNARMWYAIKPYGYVILAATWLGVSVAVLIGDMK